MTKYQIADLEQLTGIKAHTIRIWEKRYKLIEPHRTETNIRYYDDDQARKLLNVATLLAQGIKISKISALNDSEMSNLIQLKGKEEMLSDDAITVTFVNNLISCMLAFDEPGFEKVFASAHNRFGLYNAMIKVFYPFLQKTGMLWIINEAMPVQEHFASCIIRKKLMAAIDGLPAFSRKKKKFLLFLPPDEMHEIGLLFSDYIIRSWGYQTIYLGANVPLENVESAAKQTNATHLLTFFIARRKDFSVDDSLKFLNTRLKGVELLTGGSPALLQAVKMPKRAVYVKSPADLVKYLQ